MKISIIVRNNLISLKIPYLGFLHKINLEKRSRMKEREEWKNKPA